MRRPLESGEAGVIDARGRRPSGAVAPCRLLTSEPRLATTSREKHVIRRTSNPKGASTKGPLTPKKVKVLKSDGSTLHHLRTEAPFLPNVHLALESTARAKALPRGQINLHYQAKWLAYECCLYIHYFSRSATLQGSGRTRSGLGNLACLIPWGFRTTHTDPSHADPGYGPTRRCFSW